MSPARSPAKYRQISDLLAERIRAGAYDENGLPGERELAAEFAVARVTVRNALSNLQDRGLIARHERRGTLALSEAGPRRAPRLLREHVDQFLDRGRVDERRVLAFGYVGASPQVAEALGLAPGTRVLRAVRLRSLGAHTLTCTEAFVPESLGCEVTREALQKRPYVKILEALGVKFGDAEQTVAAEAASADIAQKLDVPVGSPVLKLHRVLYDTASTPVQLLVGWYRADHFEVAMRMSRSDDMTRVWIRAR